VLKRTLSIVILAACGTVAHATAAPPETNVPSARGDSTGIYYFYFPFDSSALEYDYRTNRATFDAVDALLRTERFVERIGQIEVVGSACLVGSVEVNRRISHRRAAALISRLRERHPYLEVAAPIHSTAMENPEIRLLARCLKDSLGLSGIMLNRRLRFARLQFTLKDPIKIEEPAPAEAAEAIAPSVPETIEEVKAAGPEAPEKIEETYIRAPLLSVKSNLLYDLALTPDIEVEVPIGRQWSVNGEYQRGWWVRKNNTFCWQYEALGLEGRYWLGDRTAQRVLTGWFAGVFAGAGLYDFQLRRDRGVQGDRYIAAGLSGGYARQFGTSPWGMELSLGFGYLTTDYTRYRIYLGKLVRDGAKMHFSGIVPLKAKVSLVYLFHYKKKGGKQ
jgi:hypothetical protein